MSSKVAHSQARALRAIMQVTLVAVLLLASLAALGTPVVAQSTIWRGEYYGNATLSGSPVLVRDDSAINFDWGAGSPANNVPADRFSVRWTAFVHMAAGTYTFTATVDDGVRLWVDDQLLIDQWKDQSASTFAATTTLGAGYHSLRVEYYDAGGTARISVSWALQEATSVIQEVIVDELGSGFLRGGPAGAFYRRWIGQGGHMYWTWNSTTKQYNWAKWFPVLPSGGAWEVLVYIPSHYAGTRHAKYSVFHNGGRTDVVVNQSIYSDQWVSLGTYAFMGGQGPQSGRDYVFLNDVTGEPYASISVGIDAVKFVKRDGTAPVTPPPTTCSFTPVLGFGRIWNGNSAVRSRLGCAAEAERGVWMGEQAFQGGLMYWRQDARDIYVLHNDGTWQAFGDTWQEGQTEWDVSIVAPGGLFQPKRGFGRVWRDNQSVRDRLGWATMEERGFQGSIQSFQNGRMIWSNVRGVFVLYSDGTWQRYS